MKIRYILRRKRFNKTIPVLINLFLSSIFLSACSVIDLKGIDNSSTTKENSKIFKKLSYTIEKNNNNSETTMNLLILKKERIENINNLKIYFPYYLNISKDPKYLRFCVIKNLKSKTGSICSEELKANIEIIKNKYLIKIDPLKDLENERDYLLSIKINQKLEKQIYQLNAFNIDKTNEEQSFYSYIGSWPVNIK